MKLTVLLMIIVILIIGFIFPVGIEKAISPLPSNNDFLLGAMNNSAEKTYEHINNPDEFGMNLWHKYTISSYDPVNNRYYPLGWTDNDSLFTDYSNYENEVKPIIKSNYDHNMRTLMQRPKIEWLCFGQRSDYQCETEDYVDPYYWFYSFQKHYTGTDTIDNTQYGNNQWVRKCRVGIDTSATVVSRLKANNEQTFRFQSNNFNHWDDSRCKWFIKPSIRIDKDYANNPVNYSTLVCRIDVYNIDGYIESYPDSNKIKSFDIRVRNFKPGLDSIYNGNYREEFYFSPWNDNFSQSIDSGWNHRNGNEVARGRVTYDDPKWTMSRADIRVYWYGNCDMLLDYVRVDNDVADGLFRGDYDNTWNIGNHN